jgi:hypothetical protein
MIQKKRTAPPGQAGAAQGIAADQATVSSYHHLPPFASAPETGSPEPTDIGRAA